MLNKIKKELKKYTSVERKKTNEWFFKTGKGEYGEGDIFIGVRVPDVRKVARQFFDTELNVLEKLLYSKIHEERLLALLILVAQNEQAVRQEDRVAQKKIVNFYLKHQGRVNNWDLVDLSTHYILGQAILDGIKKESLLDKMAVSKNLWTRRKAIVSTWIIIRQGKISTTLRLSKKLLGDKEDLMHKAVGWMLREAWKLGEPNKKRSTAENKKGQKAQEQVEQFLIKNYNNFPRTALRYAIERMPEQKRKRFLKGRI